MEELAENEIIPAEFMDFLPSNTTRAETALSRFPIHNLTKSEKIDIRISQKNEAGETDIYWSVSPSRDFGEPRQLAYKLDTLLINRRIDEAGRPIPKLIRLGSLREICRELNLTAGKASSDIKNALQQNASAFITAKVSYRGVDGGERRFEASFTRYSLRFYGQTLPDGRRADAVYIILNDEYWQLLNKAQFRPLNYDYLRELTPSAQRFYEVLSFRIFAALSQSRAQARLLYSEYCTRAPQCRYFDGDQMRKQMYKIHLPHMKAHYIADVEYRNTVDDQGRPDWELLYVPGKKAKAEFLAYTRKRVDGPSPPKREENRAAVGEGNLIAELTKRGITENKARDIIGRLRTDQPVMAQLRWADSIIRSSRHGSFRNPPGFYIHVLKTDVNLPIAAKGQVPTEPAKARPDAALRKDYEAYRFAALDAYLKTEEGRLAFERSVGQKERELRRQFPALLPETVKQVAEPMIQSAILRTLHLKTFSEFAATGRTQSVTRSPQPSRPRPA